jgi:transposase-like protein
MTDEIKAEVVATLQGLFEQEGRLRDLLQAVVQRALEQEVENHLQAKKYQRRPERRGYRNGYKQRRLKTRIGVLEFKLPQVRGGQFQTQLFGRYQRQEAALMTTIAEMYYQGVSTRRVAAIMEELGGFQVSSATVSRVAQELDEQLEQFRSRRLDGTEYPYLMIDARYEKVRVDGHVVSQAVLVTAGIIEEGCREILDWRVADSESEFSWDEVFQSLKRRGLRGVRMLVSDAHSGIRAAMERRFQGVVWQRCQVHFIRELLKKVAWKQFAAVAHDLKKVFKAQDAFQCRGIAGEIAAKWEAQFPRFAKGLQDGIDDCLAVVVLPASHRLRLASTNLIERLMRELKRRSRVIGIFPSRQSCHRLCGALLWEMHETWQQQSPLLRLEAND